MRVSALVWSHFCLLASLASAFQGVTLVVTNPRIVVPASFMKSPLYMSAISSSSSPESSQVATDTVHDSGSLFTADEIQFLKDTFSKNSQDDTDAIRTTLLEQLPTMPPGLIVKLKKQAAAMDDPSHPTTILIQTVAMALGQLLETQMKQARDLLQCLLAAGEIRKMDALIGSAARQGQLDAAFFSVLHLNLQTSAAAAQDNDTDHPASRVQILQHVYTRCQEEVEKTIPPGIALLNKLLRTQIDSIRANQLKHYLCPQPNVITSPDGTEIQLQGDPRILVPPSLLVDAMGKAIAQIRTVEQAGGTDRVSAATMVEAIRQVAKEARWIVGENYGVDSDELKQLEQGLQPVFRPDSPESIYIKGE